MGEKRGVWLFVAIIVVFSSLLALFSQMVESKSVDLISNGQEWFFCNATGSDLVKAKSVPLFGQVPAPYRNYASSSYTCLQSCSNPSYSGVPDPRFCNPDGDGYSDYAEVGGQLDSKCLFWGFFEKEDGTTLHGPEAKLAYFDYVKDKTKCSVCDGIKPTSGTPDCPDGHCNGETRPSGSDESYVDKNSCRNPSSSNCLGQTTAAASPETSNSCSLLSDSDKDGLKGCEDTDCAKLCTAQSCGTAPNIIQCSGVEICEGNLDEDLDGLFNCDDPDCLSSSSCSETLDWQDIILAARDNAFICYDADSSDYFGECCALGKCNNQPQGAEDIDLLRNFLLGSRPYTVYTGDKEVSNLIVDTVAVLPVPDGETCSKNLEFYPKIKNWEDYDYFEIDLMTNNEKMFGNIKVEIELSSGQKHVKTYFDLNSLSINGLAPYRWHRLKLDLAQFSETINDVVSVNIIFKGDQGCAQDNGKKISVDYMRLSKNNKDNFYCAGEFMTWINGTNPRFDSAWKPAWNSVHPTTAEDIKVQQNIFKKYQYVCDQNLPSGWTGTQCCGTDKGQYWSDMSSGCWNSFIVRNGERVNDTINDNTQNMYDKLLYYPSSSSEGKFFACGFAGSDLGGKQSSFNSKYPNTGLPLTSSVEFTPSCTIKGNYFCNGVFWSNEPAQPQGNEPVVPSRSRTATKLNIQGTEASCCPANYCFNGTTCVKGYEDPFAAATRAGSVFMPGFSKGKVQAVCILDKKGTPGVADDTADWQLNLCGYSSPEQFASEGFSGRVSDDGRVVYNQEAISRPVCTVKGDYFCDGVNWSSEKINDEWETPIAANLRNVLKPNPYPSTSQMPRSACCTQDTCFNGTRCVSGVEQALPEDTSHAYAYYPSPENSEKVCIAEYVGTPPQEIANWNGVAFKQHWDGIGYGYCEQANECWHGQDSVCVDPGNFTHDHYCKDGSWSTRTGLVASYLVQIKDIEFNANQEQNGDFTLFCDGKGNVLNDQNYISEGMSNNYCVIEYALGGKKRTIIGTSLNSDLGTAVISLNQFLQIRLGRPTITSTPATVCDTLDQNNKILDSFGNVSLCTNELPAAQQNRNNISLYYNKKANILVFSQTDENLLDRQYSFSSSLQQLLNALFGRVSASSSNIDASLVEALSLKSDGRIYAQKRGGTLITGYKEYRLVDSQPVYAMVVEYKNLNPHTEIEEAFEKISPNEADSFEEEYVTGPFGTRDYYRRIYLADDSDIESIWIVLTSKLRVSPVPWTRPQNNFHYTCGDEPNRFCRSAVADISSAGVIEVGDASCPPLQSCYFCAYDTKEFNEDVGSCVCPPGTLWWDGPQECAPCPEGTEYDEISMDCQAV